jgi:hypothetical protein
MGCMDKSFCPTLFIPNVIDWGIDDLVYMLSYLNASTIIGRKFLHVVDFYKYLI